jgi:NDP-sugar pyrophosphorylase family protein
MTALVLAGGLGTRLRPVLADEPKVLAPVAGRPFLAYLLDQLRDAGFDRAVLCTGYRGEQVEAALGSSYEGIKLVYSRETTPLGTAGALRLALPLVRSETVLVMNGDSFCGVGLGSVWKWHAAQAADTTAVLVEVGDTARYGAVSSGADGRITAFVEKGTERGAGWINAGIYVMACDRLETIPEGRPVSLEREMLPSWIEQGVRGYRTAPGTRFLDIGIPEAYAEAERFFGKQASHG